MHDTYAEDCAIREKANGTSANTQVETLSPWFCTPKVTLHYIHPETLNTFRPPFAPSAGLTYCFFYHIPIWFDRLHHFFKLVIIN